MSTGKNTFIILALSIILPVLIFIGVELSTINEDEQMLEDIYVQQIDAVIFSLNQYAEDYLRSYGNDIIGECSRSNYQSLISDQLRTNNLALAATAIKLGNDVQFFVFDSVEYAISENKVDSIFNANDAVIERLINYKHANYTKLESIGQLTLTSGIRVNAIMLVMDDDVPLLILVDGQVFIEDLLNPRIQQVATQNLLISIRNKEGQAIAVSDSVQLPALRFGELWLFPEFEISVAVIGESIDDLIGYRKHRSLIALTLLIIFFLLGAFLMTRTLRKQIQLSQAKSDFVANVSHEIRTPLSLISMFNETLLLGRITSEEKRQEYYEIIDKETNRLKNIVNKILSFSQIEANKRTYDFNEIKPDLLVSEIITTYSYHLEREQFELIVELNSADAKINVDKEAFSEALVNLIDNAVKYSGDKKRLVISSEVRPAWYVLTVRDSGRGIPADQLPFIFDQFYRVRSDDNFEAKGTGLGLALVKAILEVHGGRVEVQSTVGEGSEFQLYYPLFIP